MKFKTLIVSAMAIMASIALAAVSFGQEMPKPGMIIDKSNYKKYAHLYPVEFLADFFETGFNGLLLPKRMKVVETKDLVTTKKPFEYAAKNKGKYSLDQKGNITPAFNSDGMPFPDISRNDKDFATKFMWNYAFKFMFDDSYEKGTGGSFEKRRGEPVRRNTALIRYLYFKSRLFTDPKPDLSNPIGLHKAMIFHYILPDSVKNTINMSYRYADTTKTDDTYLYLPAMRRVLRAEAGQRSTPVLGSTQALDDFFGFDGRTPEFTYTMVREQKALVVARSSSLNTSVPRNWKKAELFWPEDNYELRDVYVIDIKPKDPKYPQTKKQIWIDKETAVIYYSAAWDRAGKLWKVWEEAWILFPTVPGGGTWQVQKFMGGIDVQFGLATAFLSMDEPYNNKGGMAYTDFTPNELLKLAR